MYPRMDAANSSGEPSNEGSLDSADSSSQPKPKYIRTSCDLCKRMKIKCERQSQSCVHCIARGVKCDMTFVKRRKPVKRATHFGDVESRIQRIESVLNTSRMNEQLADASSEIGKAEPPTDLNDKLSTLLISPSSGFSLFSPQGLQWILERTGSNELFDSIPKIARHNPPSSIGQAEVWRTLAPSNHEPLPPKQTADIYVAHYFENFNCVFPLYDRKIFYEHYELQYSGRPVGGTAWYASLNVVLCIGSLLLQDERETGVLFAGAKRFREEIGWKYFRNAASCSADLMFGFYGNLMAVQALCGLAFIQQVTLDPQPIHILLAAACRLALGMGLHRKLDDFGLSQSEINQRRNIFWILYFLDKSMSLRNGQPSAVFDDDVGIDLPLDIESSEIMSSGSQMHSILRCHAELARLESRIYTELYSVKASNSPQYHRLKAVGQLDKDLLEWREALPIEIRPAELMKFPRKQFMPYVMLHFAYLNCLATVHRASMNQGSWANLQSKQDDLALENLNLNPRIYASQSICLAAARSTIDLFQRVNEHSPGNSIIWMTMYYPLSAFLLLFANLLQNPQDPYIASDLELMEFAISYLTPSIVPKCPFTTTASIQTFLHLYMIAVKFVEKKNAQDKKNVKRAHGESASEESQGSLLISKLTKNDITNQRTNASGSVSEPTNDPLNPSAYNTYAQPYHPQDFMALPIDVPEPLPDATMFPDMDYSYPTNMDGFPIFLDTVQWERDLQNLWNGHFTQEN